VSVDEDGKIYLASGVFDGVLGKTVEQLRDKSVFSISKDAVTSFEVVHAGKKFVFEKKKEEKAPAGDDKDADTGAADAEPKDRWICRGLEGVKLDNARMEQYLAAFEGLKAATYPDMKKEALLRPSTAITIRAFDAETTLSLFKKDSDNRWVALSSASPYVFTIDDWKARKFFIDSLDTFKLK
jgi:hypothetical protein